VNRPVFDPSARNFPAGTMSGLPTIRAMPIISELAPWDNSLPHAMQARALSHGARRHDARAVCRHRGLPQYFGEVGSSRCDDRTNDSELEAESQETVSQSKAMPKVVV